MKKRSTRFIRLCSALAFLGAAFTGQAQTTTFSYTGAVQTYTVAPGVYTLNVDAYGAQGGGTGGKGGRVQATLAVSPGDVLNIYVGGQGGPQASNSPGGWNGGGNAGPCTVQYPGAGGGGASDIRMYGTGLGNRVIVAGGGGGSHQINSATNAGAGGGLTGGNVTSTGNTCIGSWATGGTQTAGGNSSTTSGTCCFFTPSPSNNGSLGQGGTGAGPATSCNNGDGGAGGGGGYYGGGAGGTYTAGGGGSSFTCTCASSVVHTQGVQTGNGQILITPGGTAIGRALNFDGVDDYVFCGNFMTASYTKEAWVYITNLALQNNFVSGGADGAHALWASTTNGNKLSAGHNGNWTQVIDATPLAANTWYHVAVTYDAPTTTMKLYKNGILVSSNTAVPPYTGGTAVRIGAYDNTSNLFGGSIGEVRIWNRALCQGEIQNYMNVMIPSTGTGLIANYQFLEGTANSANPGITSLTDVSGAANNGTLNNFALTGTTSNWIAPGPPDCGAYSVYNASFTLSSTQTNVTCNGGNNGSATVTPSPSGTYNYTWTPSGGNAATASGLTAGTYTCSVTNTCGGNTSITVTITQPASGMTSSATQVNETCNGGTTGSATVTVSGGTAPYTYSWTPSGGTAATASSLAAGTYTCNITDAGGCTHPQVVTITQPTAITNTFTQVNVSCNGGSNGSATVTATGGTGAYTYSWTPSGGTAATASGLAAGTYTCTIHDANNCIHTQLITITQPSALTTTFTQTNVSCNGGSNGSASVTLAGGTSPYSYSWTPSGGNAATATGLSAGTYTCSMIDANGCTISQTVTITQPSALANTFTQTNVSCNGGSDGTATANVTGGTAPYTYSWSPTGATTATATGLSAGPNLCYITDANGCTTVQTVLITQPTALSISASQTNVTCNGGSDATATASGSGGTGSYSYSWSPSGGNSSTASGLSAGTYTCTMNDANGCTVTQTYTITQPAPVTVSVSESGAGACNGGTDTLTAIGALTYTWSPSAGLSSITGSPVVATVTTSMTYTVTGTDGSGCTGMNTITVNLYPNPATPVITVSYDTLTSSVTGTSYQWYLNGNPIPGATNQTYVTSSNGNYTVMVTNSFGCSSTSAPYAYNSTGVKVITGSTGVKLYPNPSMGDVTVEITNPGQHTMLYLYDMLGQQIKAVQITGTITTLHHSDLAEGMYTYRVMQENVLISTGRLIMQK